MSFLSKIFPFLQNRAEKFENWTVNVAKYGEAAQGNIDIINQRNLATNYNSGLKEFSEDYIEIIDKNDDGKISYDEFVRYNMNEATENASNLSLQDMLSYQRVLYNIYIKLNVDNEGDSKNQLDYREVMNYFYTMDSNNEYSSAGGNISQYEFIKTSNELAAGGASGSEILEKLKANYNQRFQNA